MMSTSGGFFSGLVGRRRNEAGAAPASSVHDDDDLEQQFPVTPPPTGYGSIDNNFRTPSFDGGSATGGWDEEDVVMRAEHRYVERTMWSPSQLLPGAQPPDRPSAPTPTE